ncbi:MAG: ion channel [Saprospiraceae bacterium]|nr:ion channel [Saprospiraceae bacterium]
MAKKINHKNKIKYDVSETDDSVFLQAKEIPGVRLLKPDGSFNIERRGLSDSNMYERIVNFSWTKIILAFLLFYFFINAIFALLFLSCGTESINGMESGTLWENYTGMLYFSIQTFTTVGYGHLNPVGSTANLISAFVAFTGLISFALLTGLSFAKFSKPEAHIIFSKNILIAPNPLKNEKPSLQFRIVNTSKNQLIDMEARVTITWLEEVDGTLKRMFERLDLELESIHLFPLNWTIIHMIDKRSPLYELTKEQMISKNMELLILVKGFDDTYSQKIHSKRSYSFSDLVDGARFISMYEHTHSNTVLHLTQIHNFEPYQFDD